MLPGMARRPHPVRHRRLLPAFVALVLVAGSVGTAVARSPIVRGRGFVGTCTVLPATNVWNRRIDGLPVRADSATLMNRMGLTKALHPDFGTYAGYGIPVNRVSALTPRSPVAFTWPSESDAGPYPIPTNPKIEGAGAAGDRHILMVDMAACRLWELFAAQKTASGWRAGSGAIFDLRSNALRPDGWTSADAAGLPILPGLLRWNEVKAGRVAHAIRFTTNVTSRHHLWPARHDAGSTDSWNYPPMGARFRMKPSFDASSYGPRARVVITALKRYGLVLADNGSPWYFTGERNRNWPPALIEQLKRMPASAFEAVDTSSLR